MEHQNNFNYLDIDEIADINGGYHPFGWSTGILVDPVPIKISGISLLKRR